VLSTVHCCRRCLNCIEDCITQERNFISIAL
jgi:hypothetical protein